MVIKFNIGALLRVPEQRGVAISALVLFPTRLTACKGMKLHSWGLYFLWWFSKRCCGGRVKMWHDNCLWLPKRLRPSAIWQTHAHCIIQQSTFQQKKKILICPLKETVHKFSSSLWSFAPQVWKPDSLLSLRFFWELRKKTTNTGNSPELMCFVSKMITEQ